MSFPLMMVHKTLFSLKMRRLGAVGKPHFLSPESLLAIDFLVSWSNKTEITLKNIIDFHY